MYEDSMTDQPLTGHDGPYPAPVVVPDRVVQPEWIDYNGHMNVGYYGIAFDNALDVLLSEHLGVGVEHVEAAGQGPYVVQSHMHFLAEMLEGQRFFGPVPPAGSRRQAPAFLCGDGGRCKR
ncbi:thioesterase family protein [Jhaorihella thermophila]